MRIKCIVTALLVCLFVISSCSKEGPDNNPNNNNIDCSGAPKTFSGDVNPSCSKCLQYALLPRQWQYQWSGPSYELYTGL
jgi:hypothetical protein